MLEGRQINRILHAGLQTTDLVAQFLIKGPRAFYRFAIALMGLAEGGKKRRQAFVELLQVTGKLALTAVGNGQHQHRQVIQHRHQLIPVQATLHALTQRLALGLMALRQLQLIEQPHQTIADMRSNRAITRLGYLWQGVGGISRALD